MHRVYFLRHYFRGQHQTWLQTLCMAELLELTKQRNLRPSLGVAELLECILQRMDPLMLQISGSGGIQHQLLDRAWQMETYRAAAGILSPRHWLSPDVGKV